MDNSQAPENSQNPQNPQDEKKSFLEQVLETPEKQTEDVSKTPGDASGIPTQNPKKPRDPVTTGMVLKFIGSLLLIAVIFFGSFLAYIVFNPDQAAFFVNIFGIDPKDIQNLLKNLINGSFGSVVLILSIIWIISLFRAIWTPKELQRKRLLRWIIGACIGIFLFTIIGFWAYLYKIINDTDYSNPGGDVTLYDNSLFNEEIGKKYSQITSTKNIIGPITIRYDISANAKTVAKRNLIDITGYEIDFDGAQCVNNKSIITGTDPIRDAGIICTFDTVRNYKISGKYTGKDRLGQIQSLEIPLDSLEIKGLVDIRSTTNRVGNPIMTIDASRIKNLGSTHWVYPKNNTTSDLAILTENLGSIPNIVCLTPGNNVEDRCFIIAQGSIKNNTGGSLVVNTDTENPLAINMSLTGVSRIDEVTSVDWIEKDGTRLCKGKDITCSYAFNSYGTKTITATLTLANDEKIELQNSITLNEPLVLDGHAQIRDQNNVVLNTTDTFDSSQRAYIITNVPVPSKLTLSAKDVRANGNTLSDINWKISTGNTRKEMVGEEVSFDLEKTQRYTIEANYSFKKSNGDTRSGRDIVILDLEKQALQPVLNITQSSDYTPAQVTVDASSSYNKNGEIKKFVFNFGEGRPDAVGDSIQTYTYNTPGEKEITLTIINEKNEQATLKKYIVLKDTPKTIGFSTSMSPGIVDTPVDFIADKSTGEVEEYIWNFGDNTQIRKGYEVSHNFEKSGKYTITLTLRYVDGTEKNTTQEFQVTTQENL